MPFGFSAKNSASAVPTPYHEGSKNRLWDSAKYPRDGAQAFNVFFARAAGGAGTDL